MGLVLCPIIVAGGGFFEGGEGRSTGCGRVPIGGGTDDFYNRKVIIYVKVYGQTKSRPLKEERKAGGKVRRSRVDKPRLQATARVVTPSRNPLSTYTGVVP